MENERTVKRYVSAGGTTVYKLPVEAFPNHVTNCFLVMGDPVTLIDAASGWESSNDCLVDCFAQVRERFGETVRLEDVGSLIITHGHIDHFGGLNFVVDRCGARISIHELDMSVIQNFKERLIVATKNLQIFLNRAGLPPDGVANLVAMHKWSKDLFKAAQVHVALEDGALANGFLRIHHTPGHCPGQICIQLDDLLFTADHVLSDITPLQSPEFITRHTGLSHYLDSLRKVRDIPGISLALGGHESDVPDLARRVDEIISFHNARLNKTLEICHEPKTVAQIAHELFGAPKSYHVLLAFLETGAHVEYLYERGKLAVVNVEEVDHADNPVLLYQKQ